MDYISLIVFLCIFIYILIVHLLTNFLSFTQPNILSFYSIVFFVMCISLISPFTNNEFVDRPGYYDLSIALFLHIFFILLPYTICYVSNFNNLKLYTINFKRSKLFRIKNEKVIFYVIFLIFFFIFLHQLFFIPNIPIFLLLQNVSGDELTMAREESFKLNSNFYVYFWHFNRMIFAPLVTLVSFLIYKHEIVNKKKWFIIFLFTLLIACLNSALSSALAPVAIILLMIFLLNVYLNNKISLKYTIFMFFVVISFPLAVEFLFSDGDFINSAGNTIYKIFNRFSIETFDRTLVYFDLFPYHIDYLGGRTNRLFLFFTGEDFFNVQNYAFIYYLESILGKNISYHLIHGSLNANFIGYMNADFGYYGVVFSSIFMGFVLTYFEIVMTRLNKNMFVISLYILLFIIFWKMMGTNPISILVGHGGILILILAFLFSTFTKRNHLANTK